MESRGNGFLPGRSVKPNAKGAFCAGAVPVDFHDRSVDERVFEIRFVRQCPENPFKRALERPAPEALPDREPIPEALRQIAPGCAGAHDPQHTFHKHAVVVSRAAGITLLAGEEAARSAPIAGRSEPCESRLTSIFQP
jgi:hypothetical protein